MRALVSEILQISGDCHWLLESHMSLALWSGQIHGAATYQDIKADMQAIFGSLVLSETWNSICQVIHMVK